MRRRVVVTGIGALTLPDELGVTATALDGRGTRIGENVVLVSSALVPVD